MPRLDMEKVSRIDLLGKRFRTLVLLVFGALSVRRVEEVRLVPCSIASYTAVVALSIPPDTRITALLLLMIAQLRRIDFALYTTPTATLPSRWEYRTTSTRLAQYNAHVPRCSTGQREARR